MSVFIYLDKKQTWDRLDWWPVYVSEPQKIKCKNGKTGFKYVTHTIFSFGFYYNLMFFIPNREDNTHRQIKLCKNVQRSGRCSWETIKFKRADRNVYVYFYGQDPRPLLFCYGNDAYKPRGKDPYDTEWVKAKDVDKCVCDDKGDNEAILKELVRVVGFLNQVDLSKHPSGANTEANGGISNCNSESSSSSTEGKTCTSTAPNGASCNYPVHTYNGATVKVKVTCSPVTTNGNGKSCYKKLTHSPAGINGEARAGADSGFRLGDVVYNNGTSTPQGTIQYYPNGEETDNNKSNHWWKPLVKVEAYFYNGDTKYQDPLLVVLEFKNGAGAGTTDKEYYKLTRREDSKMEWAKEIDRETCKKLGEGNGRCLVEYLDCIRYGLKKVLQIKLEHNKDTTYTAMGRAAGAKNRFEPLPRGGRDSAVVGCEEVDCAELTSKGYKCFKHQIQDALGGIHDEVGGIAFTLPGEGGQGGKPIEIELYKNGSTVGTCTNNKTGEIKQITYNKCMGDVYVFFYAFGGSSGNPDTVPLMLWYNRCYYAPCDRDKYFDKWIQVATLGGKGKPCEGSDIEELAKELNNVNRALNRIDLDPEKATGDGYGLPEEGKGSSGSKVKVDTRAFKTERVKLTRQDGPSKPPPPAYYRVVHRTVNEFTIGDIKSNNGKYELTTKGFHINGTGGTAEICVKQNGNPPANNHTTLATQNNWNTVVAYYSSSDNEFKLPQLIVILKTDGPIEQSKFVTASESEKNYGYYILSNNSGGVNYEYKWVYVKNEPTVTLNDATDFSLLNSIVLLLEQQCNQNGEPESYDDTQIKKAIRTAGLKSPGRQGEINRIMGKTISVSEATGTEGKCLNTTGFKLIIHNISALVEPNGKLGKNLKGVTLIAGLRFMIPTRDSKGDYKELRLYHSGIRVIYHQNTQNNIYVYFYDQDPRPLMLCYGKEAFRPMYMITYFYFRVWVKDAGIEKCDCSKGCSDNCDKLLKALVEVSNFLNPVKINEVPRGSCTFTSYYLHRFNGNLIKIKVELTTPAKDGFCYNKYTHTHNGTGKSDGEGFRLGNIEYNGKCIQEISTNNGRGASGTNAKCITSALNGDDAKNHKSADKVLVFYYKGDTAFKRPLLVALCQNSDSNTCNLYYVLQKGDEASSTVKKYNRGNKIPIDLSNTSSGGTLAQKLDGIRSKITKHLQIIIDQRPEPTLYCPPKPPQENKEYKHPFPCEERQNNQKGTPGSKGSPSTDVILASYQAQLYNTTADTPVKNGPTSPTTPKTSTIQVTPVKCEQLSQHGYRCYEHKIKDLPGVEKIGGLKFYLWDNREGVRGLMSSLVQVY